MSDLVSYKGFLFQKQDTKMKLVLIGEGLSENNDFAKSGKKLLWSILDELLPKYNLSKEDIYVADIMNCISEEKKYSKADLERCKSLLENEIMSINEEKIIIAFGVMAKEFFRIGGSIRSARSTIRDTKYGKVMVTWHPSANNLFSRDSLGIRDIDRLRGDIDNALRFVSENKLYRLAEYILVDTEEKMKQVLKEVVGKHFALDFETTGLDMFRTDFDVVCYGIGTEAGNNYIVDPEVIGDKAKSLLNVIWKYGKPVMFNASFDMLVAKRWANTDIKEVDDLQFLYFLANGGRVKKFFSLKYLALEYMDFGDYGLDEKDILNIRELDKDKLYSYCATDVRVTIDLFNKFTQMLKEANVEWSNIFGDSNATILDAYNRIGRKGVFLISELKYNGMMIDYDYLEKVRKDLEDRLDAIEKEVYELVGKINLNSTQQVLKVARNRGIELTETGKDILEKYREKDKFIDLLMEYRELMKLYKTYVVGLVEKGIMSEDAMIHSNFSLVSTATGRIASSDPNLMNIPVRMGELIEKAFISRFGENGILVKADLSQHELRVSALYSRDKNMIDSYNAGRDLHTDVAMRVYGLKEEEKGTPKEKQLRRIAKGFNFGVIYGRSPKSIAMELGIDVDEATKLVIDYFKYFSGLAKWLSAVKQFANRTGYVRTMFGRIRYLNETDDGEEAESGFIERAAVNTPVQSAASDIALLIATGIIKDMKEQGLKALGVNFIHDAILIDCPKEEFEAVSEIIKKNVKNVDIPMQKLLNFEAEIEWGKTWGDMA